MLVVDIPLISSSSMPLPFANLFFQESQHVLIPSSQNTTPHDFSSPPSQPQPPLHETSQDLPTPPSTMIHTLDQTICFTHNYDLPATSDQATTAQELQPSLLTWHQI
jgi:hypothetical protein